MNENLNEIRNYAEEMKKLYKNMISGQVETSEYASLVTKLVSEQKEDGAWSKLEDYHIDSDCRVEYLYNPTYYACAMLMQIDNEQGIENVRGAKDALEKGLAFSIGRDLAGHGYSGFADRMRNMKRFEKAGVYIWLNKNPDKATDFREMWEALIKEVKKCIAENRVFADWNEDFTLELRERMDIYDKFQNVEWLVLHTIFKCEHAISIKEISANSGLALTVVKEAARRLESAGLIKQDSRSIKLGHQICDERAFFYTNKEYRALITKMM